MPPAIDDQPFGLKNGADAAPVAQWVDMRVQYIILSITGWAWLLIAGGYVLWRLTRQRAGDRGPGGRNA